MTKESIARAPRTRPQRTKLTTKNRLNVANKDPNFVYRIVNDVRDRVEIFKQNGYEVAPADTKVGDNRVENPTPLGSVKTLPVGLIGDQPGQAVVMRIPLEWYEEDQRAKDAEIARTEESMKQQALEGNYGKLEISRG